MTQRNLQRYDFGSLRDFRGPIQIAQETVAVVEEAAPPPPPPPTYSEDELQNARMDAKKHGFTEGFMAGQQQAAAEQDTHTKNAEAAVTAIGDQIGQVLSAYNGIVKQQALQLSELALLVARKVAGAALEKNSIDVIAGLVVQALPMILPRPRIVIELNPETQVLAEAQITAYLAQQGYEGVAQFRGNAALAITDMRLDWGTGQVERSTEALWNDVEQLLARVPLELEIPNSGEDHG